MAKTKAKDKTASQREKEARQRAVAKQTGYDVIWPEQTERGAPKKGSMLNVRMAIDTLNLDCRYDLFLGRYTINGRGMDQFVGEVNDKIARAFREYCFLKLRYEPGAEAAREGLMRACEAHMYNSLADYLLSLRWDGVSRLDKWLTTYLGVADSPLHQAWGRIVLMAACRRVFDPGCKFDYVPVLEGQEGVGKSTAVKVLACGRAADERPDYFSDSTILDKDEKQQMELTKGVWFYELSEMAGATKMEGRKLKAFVTRQEERARPAYGYFKENQPRVCVFIGSINPDANTGDIIGYLNSGDRRRWWPITVGKIDIDALTRDRDQLFAEAMARAATFDDVTGEPVKWESLALDPALWDDAAAAQVEREHSDPLTDRLSTIYSELVCPLPRGTVRLIDGKHTPTAGRDYIVTDDEVWVAAKFVIELLPPTMAGDGRRMAAAMGKLGWSRTYDRRIGAADKVRGYARARDPLD